MLGMLDVNDNGDRSETELPRPNLNNFDGHFLLQKVPSNMGSGNYFLFCLCSHYWAWRSTYGANYDDNDHDNYDDNDHDNYDDNDDDNHNDNNNYIKKCA